ncbi:hypothetical protein ACHAWF_006102 [Thalassiosira exigua]
MPAARDLYASTLARAGRDGEAIVQYQKSLDLSIENAALSRPLTKEEADVRTGLGRSLQRMLRYEEAADAFLKAARRCGNDDKISSKDGWMSRARVDSLQSAALYRMRTGDVNAAISIAESSSMGRDPDLDGMHGALLLIRSSAMPESEKRAHVLRARELLGEACSSASTSPLYKWIHLASQMELSDDGNILPLDDSALVNLNERYFYMRFANANNSPFDDPHLIN